MQEFPLNPYTSVTCSLWPLCAGVPTESLHFYDLLPLTSVCRSSHQILTLLWLVPPDLCMQEFPSNPYTSVTCSSWTLYAGVPTESLHFCDLFLLTSVCRSSHQIFTLLWLFPPDLCVQEFPLNPYTSITCSSWPLCAGVPTEPQSPVPWRAVRRVWPQHQRVDWWRPLLSHETDMRWWVHKAWPSFPCCSRRRNSDRSCRRPSWIHPDELISSVFDQW